MKPLKPLPALPAKPKRKPATKKPPGEGGTSRKASSSNIAALKQTHSHSTSGPSSSASKRQRLTSAKSTVPANQIRCMTCGQTDVPLILGGRKYSSTRSVGININSGYCRPCVESGKSNLVASGTVPSTYRYYFATDTSQLSISTAPPSISNTPQSSSQTASS